MERDGGKAASEHCQRPTRGDDSERHACDTFLGEVAEWEQDTAANTMIA